MVPLSCWYIWVFYFNEAAPYQEHFETSRGLGLNPKTQKFPVSSHPFMFFCLIADKTFLFLKWTDGTKGTVFLDALE